MFKVFDGGIYVFGIALTFSIVIFEYPVHVYAYDYVEHEAITSRALRLVLGELEEPSHKQLIADTIWALQAQDHLCQDPLETLSENEKCLSLSDIPALAGDHASSPMIVKWRWFNDQLDPRSQTNIAVAMANILYKLRAGASASPENNLMRAPSHSEFLRYLWDMRSANWPLGEKTPDDICLQTMDDAYVALSERGHSHFRPTLENPTAVLASERYKYPLETDKTPDRNRHKPKKHAFATYADLHAGAIHFARLAKSDTDDNARLYRGIAFFLELNALHYIQDCTAAGHIVPDTVRQNNASLLQTHGHHNDNGLDVFVPAALCDQLTLRNLGSIFPRLADACKQASQDRLVRIFGDHQLARHGRVAKTYAKSNSKEGLDADDFREYAATWEWAVLVSALSMYELLESGSGGEGRGPFDSGPMECIGRDPDDKNGFDWSIENGVPESGPELDFYRCVHGWWEQKTDVGASRSDDITRLWSDGSFIALRSVPEIHSTVEKPKYYDDFAGPHFVQQHAIYARHNDHRWFAVPTISVGVGISSPRRLFPVDVQVVVDFSTDLPKLLDGACPLEIALAFSLRAFWTKDSDWFTGADVLPIWRDVIGELTMDFGGRLWPVGYSLHDGTCAAYFLQLGGGWSFSDTWNVGLAGVVQF